MLFIQINHLNLSKIVQAAYYSLSPNSWVVFTKKQAKWLNDPILLKAGTEMKKK